MLVFFSKKKKKCMVFFLKKVHQKQLFDFSPIFAELDPTSTLLEKIFVNLCKTIHQNRSNHWVVVSIVIHRFFSYVWEKKYQNLLFDFIVFFFEFQSKNYLNKTTTGNYSKKNHINLSTHWTVDSIEWHRFFSIKKSSPKSIVRS